MPLSKIEHAILMYFVLNRAHNINIDGRFYPYVELLMSFRDKIKLSLNQFSNKSGKQLSPHADPAARHLIDKLIDEGGFSTAKQDYGHDMHQFQKAEFLVCIKNIAQDKSQLLANFENTQTYWQGYFEQLLNNEQ